MNQLQLTIAYLKERPLTTSLNVILLTLGILLMSLLSSTQDNIQTKLSRDIQGIDLVVGTKGSPLQLLLATVYHLDVPSGNISLRELKKVAAQKSVDFIVPIGIGDTYKGHRIVGTSQDIIKLKDLHLAEGHAWDEPFEVVLGHTVASQLHLNIGDTFVGSHGLTSNSSGHVHADHPYEVVGILAPTNSQTDQLILTDISSVWIVHEHKDHDDHDDHAEAHHHEEHEHHDKHHHEEEHEHYDDHHHEAEHEHHDAHHHAKTTNLFAAETLHQSVTAAYIRLKTPTALIGLPRWINANTALMAAGPVYELTRLLKMIGMGYDTFQYISYGVILLAALLIFTSLSQALNYRQYDLGIMRCIGASKRFLMSQIFLEGYLTLGLALISSAVISLIINSVLTHLFPGVYMGNVVALTGHFLTAGAIAFVAVTLACLLPALRAYRTTLQGVLNSGR